MKSGSLEMTCGGRRGWRASGGAGGGRESRKDYAGEQGAGDRERTVHFSQEKRNGGKGQKGQEDLRARRREGKEYARQFHAPRGPRSRTEGTPVPRVTEHQ